MGRRNSCRRANIGEMKRLALLLFFLIFSELASGGSSGGQQVGYLQSTVVIGDLLISSEGNAVVARRGKNLVWRNSSVFGARLAKGPGNFVTAIGISTVLTLELMKELENGGLSTDPLRSFVLDPSTGKILVEINGLFIREQSGTALFMRVNGPNPGEDSVLAIFTNLSLTTLRPEVKKIGAAALFPPQCLKNVAQKEIIPEAGSVSIRGPVSAVASSFAVTSSVIRISNSKCNLSFGVDLDALKITLINFKPLK